MISLVKIRDRYTGEIQTKFEGSKSIRDRDTIIVDDMISTGNSIINAAKVLKELGVQNIFVLCNSCSATRKCNREIKRCRN